MNEGVRRKEKRVQKSVHQKNLSFCFLTDIFFSSFLIFFNYNFVIFYRFLRAYVATFISFRFLHFFSCTNNFSLPSYLFFLLLLRWNSLFSILNSNARILELNFQAFHEIENWLEFFSYRNMFNCVISALYIALSKWIDDLLLLLNYWCTFFFFLSSPISLISLQFYAHFHFFSSYILVFSFL